MLRGLFSRGLIPAHTYTADDVVDQDVLVVFVDPHQNVMPVCGNSQWTGHASQNVAKEMLVFRGILRIKPWTAIVLAPVDSYRASRQDFARSYTTIYDSVVLSFIVGVLSAYPASERQMGACRIFTKL